MLILANDDITGLIEAKPEIMGWEMAGSISFRISPEPAEKNYQDKEGVLLWEFDLKPRAKQEINMEFMVTYPKDAPVFGL